MWEIPLHEIPLISKIVHKVIWKKLIENVVPKSLSRDLKLTLCAIWQWRFTFWRITLENQIFHDFETPKISIVVKSLNNLQKSHNFDIYFRFPKIFSNTSFRESVFGQDRDEVLKKNSLGSDFQLRSSFFEKKTK